MKSLKTDDYEIQVFLKNISSKESEERIIKDILEKIQEDKKIGFAGFSNKKALKNNLKKFLKKSQKGIDLGTGCGLFPFLLEKEGYLIDGIDFNKKYLLIAKKYKEKTK